MGTYTELNLFSGYGGFSLGLRLAGLNARVNRLKCLGNGIVPASLAVFLNRCSLYETSWLARERSMRKAVPAALTLGLKDRVTLSGMRDKRP